jgi:tRNA(Ile)-lysidine synthase
VRKGAADKPVSADEAAMLFSGFGPDPPLVLAVSGGPDSTALLWLAARWRDSLACPPKLIAVTVDHGLRPESSSEAQAVKRLARTLKVEHHTLRWTGRKPKTGIQEAARNARYRLLASVAHRAGVEYILTAHTQDDQAETVLFRLVRGSGLAGLRGMAYGSQLERSLTGKRQLYLSRPLLGLPKSRLLATLAAAGIPFADDPSNRDPRFTRPRLRALMRALEAEGLTATRLTLLAERITRVEILLHDLVNDTVRRLAPAPWPDEGPVALDLAAFEDLPEEIQLRVLGRMIDWVGNEGPVELGKLEALHAALDAPVSEAVYDPAKAGCFRRTLAGAMITVTGTKLIVERAPSRRTGGKTGKSGPKAPFTKPRHS